MEKKEKGRDKTREYTWWMLPFMQLFFLTLKKKQVSMELENRPILIAGFAGSRWRHRRL